MLRMWVEVFTQFSRRCSLHQFSYFLRYAVALKNYQNPKYNGRDLPRFAGGWSTQCSKTSLVVSNVMSIIFSSLSPEVASKLFDGDLNKLEDDANKIMKYMLF